MTMTELAIMKHNILETIYLNLDCCLDSANGSKALNNALNRLYTLALLCNDADKLRAIEERSNIIIDKHFAKVKPQF